MTSKLENGGQSANLPIRQPIFSNWPGASGVAKIASILADPASIIEWTHLVSQLPFKYLPFRSIKAISPSETCFPNISAPTVETSSVIKKPNQNPLDAIEGGVRSFNVSSVLQTETLFISPSVIKKPNQNPLDAIGAGVRAYNVSSILQTETLPISPEERAAQIKQQQGELINNITLFATLFLMDSALNESQLLKIINDTKESHRSLLEVYMDTINHAPSFPKRSFFQRQMARLIYFGLFNRNVLTNLIETFINTFLTSIDDLIKEEDGKNLVKLTDTALKEISQFLGNYIKATQRYAEGHGTDGTRDDYIKTQLLEALYNKTHCKSQEELCQKFAQIAIREFLPRIQFFETYQESSWTIVQNIGIVFNNTWGLLLNWFMRIVLNKTLPTVVNSLIETGMESTEPTNLSFRVSLLEGIHKSLEKSNRDIDKAKKPSIDEEVFTEIEIDNLEDVLDKLMQVLKLESCETSELKEMVQTVHEPLKWYQIKDKSIQSNSSTLFKAGLSYMKKPENVNALLLNFLELTNGAFKFKQQKQEQLKQEYKALKDKVLDEASLLCNAKARRSIEEKFRGLTESETQAVATLLQKEEQKSITETMKKLTENIQSIQSKQTIYYSQHPDMTHDLDSLNLEIGSYYQREIARYKIALVKATVPPTVLQGYKETMFPIFHNIEALQNKIFQAKQLNDFLNETQSLDYELERLGAISCIPSEIKLKEFKTTLNFLEMSFEDLIMKNPLLTSSLEKLNGTYMRLVEEEYLYESLSFIKEEVLDRFFDAVNKIPNGQPIIIPDLLKHSGMSELEILDLEKNQNQVYLLLMKLTQSKNLDQLKQKEEKIQGTIDNLLKTHSTTQNNLYDQAYKEIQKQQQILPTKLNRNENPIFYDYISHLLDLLSAYSIFSYDMKFSEFKKARSEMHKHCDKIESVRLKFSKYLTPLDQAFETLEKTIQETKLAKPEEIMAKSEGLKSIFKFTFNQSFEKIDKALPEIEKIIVPIQQELDECASSFIDEIQKIEQKARNITIKPIESWATRQIDSYSEYAPTQFISDHFVYPEIMGLFKQVMALIQKPQILGPAIILPLSGLTKAYSK